MWASYGLQIPPDTVLSWEQGDLVPTEHELTALAAALWCAPRDLLGRPTTLREYRWAGGMAVEDLARAVFLRTREYERMEERNRWTGNDRQTAALGEALGIGTPELLALTGRDTRLAEHLRSAVTVRWQAYVKPVGALVPCPPERIEEALRRLHGEYQALMTSTLSWSASAPTEDKGGPFLAGILGRFWELIAER